MSMHELETAKPQPAYSVSLDKKDVQGVTFQQPVNAAQTLLQLQRNYGNRYVQRMVNLARKGDGDNEVAPEVEDAIQRARGGGQVLDSGVRQQMEPFFGADFSNVHVHTDNEADTLNRTVDARAFTTGQDIFFSRGGYNPSNLSGQELLAHELTHVIQQDSIVRTKLNISEPGDDEEQEAEQVAKAVINGERQARTKFQYKTTDNQGCRSAVIVQKKVGGDPTLMSISEEFASELTDNELGEQIKKIEEFIKTISPGKSEYDAQQANLLILDKEAAKRGDKKLFSGKQRDRMPKIPERERGELIRLTGDRLGLAFTNFKSACQSNKDALDAAARADAEMVKLVTEVFIGFAAPFFAKNISVLANKLPVDATTLEYRIALAALERDYIKALFQSSTTIAKKKAIDLFGETETTEFIDALGDKFNLVVDDLDTNLTNLTDAEIGVLYIAFDPIYASEGSYKGVVNDLVKRYESQVLPIGESSIHVPMGVGEQMDISQSIQPCWVVGTGTKLKKGETKLANLRFHSDIFGTITFWGWITDDFKDIALTKAQRFNLEVKTVEEDKITAFRG